MYMSGQASSPTAQAAGVAAKLLADIGWRVVCDATTPVTSSGPPRDVRRGAGLALSVSELSARAQDFHLRVKNFIQEHVLPVEQDVLNWQANSHTKWTVHPRMEQLKVST